MKTVETIKKTCIISLYRITRVENKKITQLWLFLKTSLLSKLWSKRTKRPQYRVATSHNKDVLLYLLRVCNTTNKAEHRLKSMAVFFKPNQVNKLRGS